MWNFYSKFNPLIHTAAPCILHWAAQLQRWLWHSQASFQPKGQVLSAISIWKYLCYFQTGNLLFPGELQLSTHREGQWRNMAIIWGISHADLLSGIKLVLTLLLTFAFSAQCHEAFSLAHPKMREPMHSCAVVMSTPGRKEMFPLTQHERRERISSLLPLF